MKVIIENKKIAVIGGDKRQLSCAVHLKKAGYEVAIFGFGNDDDLGECTRYSSLKDATTGAIALVLPLPVANNGIYVTDNKCNDWFISFEELFLNIDKKCVVFAGKCNERIISVAKKHEIKVIDVLCLDEFVIANAYLTAESAVGVAMNELHYSIKEYPILVMGYGRIGKSLCHILKAMGCSVFASARKKNDLLWIRAFGYSAIDTSKIDDVIGSCRLIFNTIPANVLDEDKLSLVNKESLIIDLASKPGGVNFEAAKTRGINVIWALALPGKKLYISSGRAEAEAILSIIDEVSSV